MEIAKFSNRSAQFLRTPAGRNIVRGASALFTLGIIFYLFDQLDRIGWQEVWQAAPRTVSFYVLFIAIYLTLPVFESVVYSMLWGIAPHKCFPALLKKRVLSKSVIDYSGEAYLYVWARRRVDLSERDLLATIKDSVIVSVATSTALIALLVAALLLAGALVLPDGLVRLHAAPILALAVGVAGVGIAVFKFRHRILFVPKEILKKILALHSSRYLLLQVLQVAQWVAVYPDKPLRSWLLLLAAQQVLYRIPFVPNREFVFAGVGLGLAQWVDLTEASMAGLLLTAGLLEKGAHLLSFALVSVAEPGPEETADRNRRP